MAHPTRKTLSPPRVLKPGQQTVVFVVDLERLLPRPVHISTSMLLEAPNWSPDGGSLLLNGAGLLWRLDLEEPDSITTIPFQGLPAINNDHVLDAPRGRIYLSANDGHIYAAPLSGGQAVRITHDPNRYHFLHGVSPDGTTLAFVDLPARDLGAAGRLALISAQGGPTRRLETGHGHVDGPEYSPDGSWIYLNSERFGRRPGHAQLARLPAGGGPLEHVVSSDTVDWFPHLSPDGCYATYLSYPTGTVGHPADLEVEIRLVSTDDWSTPMRRYPIVGGQGSLNVNSWSPDGRCFAFVAYPTREQH